MCVDYFGIALNVPTFAEDYYIAIDGRGAIYVYEFKPDERDSSLNWGYSSKGRVIKVLDLSDLGEELISNHLFRAFIDEYGPVLSMVSDHPRI